jgi:NADP-dependent 3-hydroxy acid dehydrogenase YdfG
VEDKKMKPLVAITGASSGIGKSTAKAFSDAGYPLLLMARRIENLKALSLPNSMLRPVDVTKPEEIESAFNDAQKEYGAIDCLINNAGLMMLGLPWEQDPLEWQKMVQVNILGVLNGIHYVLPDMVLRKKGTIINISSLAGRKTFQKHAVYCATKFAVHALSETIREEVSQYNVRVITIVPGAVETELITHTTSKEIQKEWWNGLNGILKPEDVAKAILFAYEQPQDVCLREIVITPTGQSS